MPLFSIVIPTCHRPEQLAACLRRVLPQHTSAGDDCEIIVTDDGATTVEAMIAAEFPRVRWIAGPRRGPAANRNHGARHASGAWLAFTDDDCLPDAMWLAAFAARASEPGIEVLEGRTYVDRPRTHPLDDSPINERGGNLWACNFAIRRERFLALGGFDENFPFASMEDTELRLRLVERGIAIAFVPEASVLHPWRRIADWRKHSRRQAKSRLLLERLHPGRGFMRFHPRLLAHFTRTVLREHLTFWLRHPIEGTRVLPGIWRAMAREILWCWRRPEFEAFEV